jgi:cephalosporin hydroxylase
VRLTIDTETRELVVGTDGAKRTLDLYGRDAFELISDLWLKTSWNQKYSYTFTWLGRPIIQHPEDLVRFQEVVWELQPDVIVETGVAHGGSLVLCASLLKAMGHGRAVIGVDIEIRPHNRAAIEAHILAPMITLIEGDSVAPTTLERVKSLIRPDDKVLVVLDSNHSKAHVAAELEAYHKLVTPGSYIVATDGIMQSVFDTPLGDRTWREDNPARAAEEFALSHPDFRIEPPRWKFNESQLTKNITAWPSAWLRRIQK